MLNMGTIQRILTYAAVAVAFVSVILAGLSRLLGQTLGLQQGSYMTLAIIAVLFAIFFAINRLVTANED